MNYCQDCKKLIGIKSKRCKKCAKIGKNNPHYTETMEARQFFKLQNIFQFSGVR